MDLILRYHDYPYNTYVSDMHPANIINKDKSMSRDFFMPDVTACNIIPLKSEPSSNMAINNYRVKFEQYKNPGKIPPEYENILESALGLLQYIGVDAAMNHSHERDTLIQHCNILYLGATGVQSLPCDVEKNIKPTFIQDSFNCYTLRLGDKQHTELGRQGKVPIGFSAILFIGGDLTFDIDHPFKREEFRSRNVGGMIGKDFNKSSTCIVWWI